MRRLLPLLCLVPMVATAVPVDLTHSGRLLSSTGAPIEGEHQLVVSLWNDATGTDIGANREWTHSFADVPVDGGYFSLTLAGIDSDIFTSSVWVDVAVGSADPLGPRQALTHVPMAAVAEVATHVPVISPATTSCSDMGAILFDPTTALLRYCDGSTWRFTSSVPLSNGSGVRRWADGTTATSCEAYRRPAAPYSYSADIGDGVYTIDPDGDGSAWPEMDVYCDQTHHAGGWTLALSAGVGRDLTLSGIDGEFLPLASGAGNPGSSVLHKMSDALINAIRTRTGSDIAYWTTTPGDGTGTLGAEIFHRGDCTFQMRQTETAVRATTCDEWTITYSESPAWAAGGHWHTDHTAYLAPFGHGNGDIIGTNDVCHTDGTGLSFHAESLAPFHRGWCSNQAWGQIWVR